jgi:O-antigen ligase/Tfp pilus assembly protein PilF
MKIFRISDFVLAASWLLAFVLSLPLIEPQALARLGAIGCMAVFGAVGIGRELAGPGLPSSRSPVFWMLPLLWTLALASVAWSAAPMDSFIAFATLGLAVLGFVVFSSGRGIFRMLVVMAPFLFLTLCGLAIWAVVQFTLFPEMMVNGQVRYPFANPNCYASLLMLGFFPAFGWLLGAVKTKVALAAAIVSAILLAGIVVIGGLAVSVLTVTGIILTLIICRGRAAVHKNAIAAVVLIGVLTTGLHIAMPGNPKLKLYDLPTRMEFQQAYKQQSLDTRFAIWKGTADMIRERGLMGTGIGTYHLFYPQYRASGDVWSSGWMAHNDLLQFWAEMGIIAPMLLLLLYVGCAGRMKAVLDLRGPESGERALCFALFMGAGMVAVNSLVNFDLYTASILCLLGFVLGMWYRYTGLVLGDVWPAIRLPARASAMTGWAFAILPLLLLAFVAQGFLRSEYHADRAEHAVSAGNWDAFQRETVLSGSSGFDRNARSYLLVASIPVGVLQQGKGLSPAARVGLVRDANGYLDKAEARNQRLPSVYYYRALAARYGLDKNKESAKAWLEQALAIDPSHAPSRMMLADMEYQAKHRKKALSILEEGLDLPPTSPESGAYYEMTASIAMENGRNDLSGRALRKLAQWKHLKDMRGKGPESVPEAVSTVE